jgi:hypothetical protein
MVQHTLPDGRRWIKNLVAVGKALGYTTDTELNVAPEGEEPAPVDIAWFRSEHDQFPLFIFEVETTASGQMVYNASKVFSQDSELFEKPLFHFHLVLTDSSERSGRIKAAKRQFGSFNYRIYGVREDKATDAISDIISQHRRVSDRLEIDALAKCLEEQDWPELNRDAVWEHAESCGFSTAWPPAYCQLALADPDYVPRLVRVLKPELDRTVFDGAQYETWSGLHCSQAFHAGILAENLPALGDRCLDALREWQGSGAIRTVSPQYGQNEDYDAFVFSLMPAIWGLLAVMLSGVPGARLWILEQMELVIEDEARVPHILAGLTAIWMLHIAAGGSEECEHYFELARRRLDAGGGVRPSLLFKPPAISAAFSDPDEWWEELTADPQPVPELDEFRRRRPAYVAGVTPTALAARYLIDETQPMKGSVSILAHLAAT